jgi:hypothetical protein
MIYTSRPGTEIAQQPSQQQVSYNTKIKSRESKQAIKTTNYPSKNIVVQHQLE